VGEVAKDDKGVPTGVCQNGIDLRDSVDDENTNRAEDWRQLGLSTKTLAMPRTSEIETR